jgi:2-C-methyl-D-erythritol 2,4-cyclodiphosphate synthase
LAPGRRSWPCGPPGDSRAGSRPTPAAPRQRTDLLQANLGSSGLVTVIANTGDEAAYTIRRAYKQPAVLLAADGRPVANVDLERGTFLPLDAYTSLEIEDIADEVLGAKRRALLDDLRGEELSRINLSLAEHRRALEANADRIKAARRSIEDLEERVEELGDALLGAVSLGDVGEHFPDKDPAVEGIAGLDLLARVVGMLEEHGFIPVSCDLTLIAERPHIAEHREEMRRNLSAALALDVDRVSLKATRPEGLGLTGDGAGCMALAVVAKT